MISTSAAITTSATHTGACPSTRIEMYSHHVPVAYSPRPNRKPSHAPSRGLRARLHRPRSTAGAASASHHRSCGAKAAVSAAPADSAARQGHSLRIAAGSMRSSAALFGGSDAVHGGWSLWRHRHAHRFDAATVGAHDAEFETLQHHRFAAAWQPAEMLRHQSRHGIDGGIGELRAEILVEIADAGAAAYQELPVGLAADVLLVLDVVFVIDLAHDLLDHILDRDQSGDAAVLVPGDGHVIAADTQFPQQHVDALGFRHEHRLAH